MMTSLKLHNGTLIIPLPLLYVPRALVVRKIHRFVDYNPKKISTALYKQQSMPDEKWVKIAIQLSLRRQRSC